LHDMNRTHHPFHAGDPKRSQLSAPDLLANQEARHETDAGAVRDGSLDRLIGIKCPDSGGPAFRARQMPFGNEPGAGALSTEQEAAAGKLVPAHPTTFRAQQTDRCDSHQFVDQDQRADDRFRADDLAGDSDVRTGVGDLSQDRLARNRAEFDVDAWCPIPRALASSAAPITSAPSRRRGTAHAGSSKCVVSQPWQFARLGLIEQVPSRIRTCRSRANPQRASGPSQTGQSNRPAARSASTTSGSTIIANTLNACRSPHHAHEARTTARLRPGGARVEGLPDLVPGGEKTPRW
jgi:hypothetical protein